jgi:hypothetical protein
MHLSLQSCMTRGQAPLCAHRHMHIHIQTHIHIHIQTHTTHLQGMFVGAGRRCCQYFALVFNQHPAHHHIHTKWAKDMLFRRRYCTYRRGYRCSREGLFACNVYHRVTSCRGPCVGCQNVHATSTAHPLHTRTRTRMRAHTHTI